MHRFSISDIEIFTGIRAHTLRIWEQRYNILIPKRTPTNIRYYDDEDLKLLLNISLLNNSGQRISRIAQLSREEINRSVEEYASNAQDADVHTKALVAAMLDLDERGFNRLLSGIIEQRGMEKSFSEVLFPYLKKLGHLWMSGSIHPAYEHFVSNLIRQKLIISTATLNAEKHKLLRKYLLFLPEGEYHELGLLFANYLIRSHGHHSIFIGPNTPLNDLEKIYEKFQPDYIFSSVTIGKLPKTLPQFVEVLTEYFPGARLLITGNYAISQKELLPPPTLVIESPSQFVRFLEK